MNISNMLTKISASSPEWGRASTPIPSTRRGSLGLPCHSLIELHETRKYPTCGPRCRWGTLPNQIQRTGYLSRLMWMRDRVIDFLEGSSQLRVAVVPWA
eukprot:753020-Hanusia_phi.AAC.8